MQFVLLLEAVVSSRAALQEFSGSSQSLWMLLRSIEIDSID